MPVLFSIKPENVGLHNQFADSINFLNISSKGDPYHLKATSKIMQQILKYFDSSSILELNKSEAVRSRFGDDVLRTKGRGNIFRFLMTCFP